MKNFRHNRKQHRSEDKTLTFRSSDDITDRPLTRDVYGNVHSSQTVHLSKVGEGDTQVIKYKGN